MIYSREEHSKVLSEWLDLIVKQHLGLEYPKVKEVSKRLEEIERSMPCRN